MGRLEGRVAIVTGAARGIGRGIALAFAREGAALALVGRDERALLDTRAECATAATAAAPATAAAAGVIEVVADISDPQPVDAMVQRTLDELGALDILVNNAGVCSVYPVVEMSLDEWRRIIDTDLTGVFLCTKAALPTMMARRYGRIISIGSQLALKGSATMAHYSAAKAGVHGFTRALAYEVAPYNITANVVAPGPIETDMLRADPQEWLDAKRAEIPLQRFGRVEEIAPTVVMLASADGSYYTGSTLNVSGGDVM